MPKSHFSAVIIAREVGETPEVLMQPYLYRGERQVKFPGGMNNEEETPEGTAVREIKQETYLSVLAEDLILVHEASPLYDLSHTKFFFATVSFSGESRVDPMSDNGGEELMPPEWVEVTEKMIDGMFGQHKVALHRALPELAQKFQSFYWVASKMRLV